MEYQQCFELAKSLNRTVVAFDIEHTGSADRRITEFACAMVTADGEHLTYRTFINPGEGSVFNGFVCRLTGISSRTVKDAQLWGAAWPKINTLLEGAVWFGFNSLASDMPIIRAETERYGCEFEEPDHVDLIRFGNIKGSLTERVQQLWPEESTPGAHRALADAHFTMMLLEGLLSAGVEVCGVTTSSATPEVTSEKNDRKERSSRKPKASKAEALPIPAIKAQPPATVAFLNAASEGSRHGQPWTEAEESWLCEQHKAGKTVSELATTLGRTNFSIQCKLFRFNLLSEKEFQAIKKARK